MLNRQAAAEARVAETRADPFQTERGAARVVPLQHRHMAHERHDRGEQHEGAGRRQAAPLGRHAQDARHRLNAEMKNIF